MEIGWNRPFIVKSASEPAFRVLLVRGSLLDPTKSNKILDFSKIPIAHLFSSKFFDSRGSRTNKIADPNFCHVFGGKGTPCYYVRFLVIFAKIANFEAPVWHISIIFLGGPPPKKSNKKCFSWRSKNSQVDFSVFWRAPSFVHPSPARDFLR